MLMMLLLPVLLSLATVLFLVLLLLLLLLLLLQEMMKISITMMSLCVLAFAELPLLLSLQWMERQQRAWD